MANDTENKTILEQIEEAVLARLREKCPELDEVDIIPNVLMMVTNPAVACRTFGLRFTQKTTTSFRVETGVSVVLAMKNLASDKERRQTLHPLQLGIIGCLVSQDLGLDIQPLAPESSDDVTDSEWEKAGIIIYDIVFKTHFYINIEELPALEKMLTLGIKYYLKPGDNIADAEDVIVTEEPAN